MSWSDFVFGEGHNEGADVQKSEGSGVGFKYHELSITQSCQQMGHLQGGGFLILTVSRLDHSNWGGWTGVEDDIHGDEDTIKVGTGVMDW